MRLLFIIIFFLSSGILAHQPKLVTYSPTFDDPYEVIFPEISKAYYGQLTGESHYFIINSAKDFLFYTSILSPKTSETYKWLSLEVQDGDGNTIYKANGSKFNWTPWYEPYARDWYWKGPEIGVNTGKEFQTSFQIAAGTYYIKVFNDDNIGHYSLAVGEAEFFGSNTWEKILTWTPIILYIGPYMDIFHWQKFDIRAFIPHIVLIVIFFILYYVYKRFLRKKKQKKLFNH